MGTYAEDITYDYYYLQWLEEIGSKYTVIFSQSILMTLKLCAIESCASYYLLPVPSLYRMFLTVNGLVAMLLNIFEISLEWGWVARQGRVE